MSIKISSRFATVILAIGIFSTVLALYNSLPAPVYGQQSGHNMGGSGSDHGMSGGSSQGMGMGGGDNAGHGMMTMSDVPGFVQQKCHSGDGMPPHYCEPKYNVMSSVKGLKISNINPISDNRLEVIIENMNRISTLNSTAGQQNIVIVGGGGDLAGSTVIDITASGSQKITTELQLIGFGSIYSQDRISIHLFPLTT